MSYMRFQQAQGWWVSGTPALLPSSFVALQNKPDGHALTGEWWVVTNQRKGKAHITGHRLE